MSILTPTPKSIQRLAFDVTAVKRTVEDQKVERIVQLLNGADVLKEIEDKSISRYATYIEESKEESGITATTVRHGKPSGALEGTKRSEAASLAFASGLYELTDVFVLRSIWEQHATVYSGKGARYTYDDADLAESMRTIRERGEITLSQQTSDLWAAGCGSAVLHFSTVGDDLIADPYPLSAFHWAHGPMIVEEGKERPTNSDRLDEAFAVAVCKKRIAASSYEWLVWFGESDLYPDGRLCSFKAGKWFAIPGVDWGKTPRASSSSKVLDWTKSNEWKTGATMEEIGNPFTVHRKKTKDAATPEYPIAIPRGHSSIGLAPTANLDLLPISIEYGVAASVILGSAQESALGQKALERDMQSGGKVSETVWTRLAVLDPGQKLAQAGWSAVNSKEAMQVTIDQIRLVADNHHAPGFLVAPNWSQWPSGEAQRQARTKLEQYRQKRIGFNRSVQRRVWQIERTLINMSESKIKVNDSVEETWNPGSLVWPEDPLKKAQVIKTYLDASVYKLADAIGEARELETTEQVFNFLEERKKFEDRVSTEIGGEVGISLSITDAPKYVTVNEARVSQGLGKLMLADGSGEDPDGQMTLAQFEVKSITAVKPPAPGTLAAQSKAGAFLPKGQQQ